MIEVGIMIEAQNGVYWPQWQRLAKAAEDLGFVGLWRSDHFTNAEPPDKASLELWISLTWLLSPVSKRETGGNNKAENALKKTVASSQRLGGVGNAP
jgi:alkanesulfonate monooxygenase SsuD/methylene tetrahydromethanopterin reductase-like flavin-dependent oxidoreductase (luciferase family)